MPPHRIRTEEPRWADGPGVLTVPGSLTIDRPGLKTIWGTLKNDGQQARWLDGDILLNDGGSLHNAPGALFEIETDADCVHGFSADGLVENDGIFRKLTGGEELKFRRGVKLNNRDTVASGVRGLSAASHRKRRGSGQIFSARGIDVKKTSYVPAIGAVRKLPRGESLLHRYPTGVHDDYLRKCFSTKAAASGKASAARAKSIFICLTELSRHTRECVVVPPCRGICAEGPSARRASTSAVKR